jgi:hypothetical protein
MKREIAVNAELFRDNMKKSIMEAYKAERKEILKP